MTSPEKPAVISLGLTKSGKRAGASESVTISVTCALQWLWAWKNASSSRCPLTPAPHHWRKKFSECVKALNLEEFEFRPYSLRRGGATCWFGKHGSLDRIIVLGRWAAARTARIYINDGLAMVASLKLPRKSLLPFLRTFHQQDLARLPSALERAKAGWGELEGVVCQCGEEINFVVSRERLMDTCAQVSWVGRMLGGYRGVACFLWLGRKWVTVPLSEISVGWNWSLSRS